MKDLVEHKSPDMFGEERTYNYRIKKIGETKRGPSYSLLFVTDPEDDDDSLHFIEDIAEELCKLNNLKPESVRFFESRGKQTWEIEMNWDNGRFRGTSWVLNDGSDVKLSALIKTII